MTSPESEPSTSLLKHEWKGLVVEYGQLNSVGEFDFAMPKQGVSVAFAPHTEVVWSVDGGARQSTSLPAGSVFLYGDREFVWHRRMKPSEYVNLTLDPTVLQAIATDHGLPSTVDVEHRVIFQDPTILHVAQLLKGEVLSGGVAGNLYAESLRNLLAVHLLRNHTQTPVKPTQDSPLAGLKLKQLQDYIEDHLAEELAIATLAALIPISPFHFARAFKAALGEPPHRYVLHRRLERAKALLSVPQLTIAEVAYQVGFANQSHFTAQFRKAIGLTPKQFRERG
jgi:AraC family transcriptional regulator